MTKKCSVQECDRESRGNGLCLMHYKRLRYRGSLDRSRWGKQSACIHCGKKAVGFKLCRSHYYFFKKYGDALYAEKHPKEDVFINTKGYLTYRAKDGQKRGVPVHRVVSCATAGDTVHHINGVKTDNRPENLHVFREWESHLTSHASLEVVAFALFEKGYIGFDRDTGKYFVSDHTLINP